MGSAAISTSDTRIDPVMNLFQSLVHLCFLQRQAVDRLALQEAILTVGENKTCPLEQLSTVVQHLRLQPAQWSDVPDPARLPLLMHEPQTGWRVLKTLNSKGQWVSEVWNAALNRWREEVVSLERGQRFAGLSLVSPHKTGGSPVARLIINHLLSRKRLLVEAGMGGALLALITVAASLYAMQVFDRVIAAGSHQALLVLSVGMLLTIGFAHFARRLRAGLCDLLIREVDGQLARAVYLRLLAVRLDQWPRRVGSLASQLRGYESVRSFMALVATQLLMDAPFSLLLLGVVAVLAGPLALIPWVFMLISLGVGFWHKGRVLHLTQRQHAVVHQKAGLLLETVEGVEAIKSAQGGWRMLGRWLDSSQEDCEIDQSLRRTREQVKHLTLSLQHIALVLMLASGAVWVGQGELSLGGLVACAMLCALVLEPMADLAAQLVQWGQMQAALQGLDALWRLESEHHGLDEPLVPDALVGEVRSENVRVALHDKVLLDLPELHIRGGEKIAVLGPVGAGKTTLLRLLSGLYKPQQGRMLLDGVDIQQMAKPWLAEHIGYLLQEGRLLSGSLRENLLSGMADPGDNALLVAARQTGLFQSMIACHPLGLAQPIRENGLGLSAGQRQLIHLTQVILQKPRIWLLDEPTSALDRNTASNVIETVRKCLSPQDTLVVVTQKPEWLQLVDRVLVVAGGRVVADGPRDAVLAGLRGAVSTSQEG